MSLRVWQDAIEYYRKACGVLADFPFEARRSAANTVSAVDSVHRNIAEGYCRRTGREYLYHLNVALGSLGESVSAFHAYRTAQQLSEEQFQALDSFAYRLENQLLKMVQGLERRHHQTTPSVRETQRTPFSGDIDGPGPEEAGYDQVSLAQHPSTPSPQDHRASS
jgi:four helix bundle protein